MQRTRTQGCLRNSRGAAAVEFALLLLPLLYIIGGAVDFGLAYFVSHIVQNAAREGARFAATLPALQPNDSRVLQVVQERLPDMVLFADFENPAHITTQCASNAVTVRVSGLYNFTFLKIIGFTNVSMDRFVTMRYEQNPPCP